jgi:hypothetical protein
MATVKKSPSLKRIKVKGKSSLNKAFVTSGSNRVALASGLNRALAKIQPKERKHLSLIHKSEGFKMGNESFFSPADIARNQQHTEKIMKPIINKALPKQQRLNIHDIRDATIGIPLAIGGLYMGYHSAKRIHRALKKGGFKKGYQDVRSQLSKNLRHAMDLQAEYISKRQSGVFMGARPKYDPYYKNKKKKKSLTDIESLD